MTPAAAVRKSLLFRFAAGVLLAASAWVLTAAPANAVNLPSGRVASASQETAAPVATDSKPASIESSGEPSPLEVRLAAAGVSIGSQYAIIGGLVVIGVAVIVVRARGRRRS